MTVGHDPAPCDACGPFYGYSSGESRQLGVLILGELGNVSAPAGFTVSGLVVRTSVDSDSADIVLTLERVEQRDTSAWSLTVGGRELSFVDAYYYLDEDNGSHAAFWRGNPGWQAGEQLAVSVVVSGSAFTDDPIVAGETPVRSIHFTELRTRIDALRGAQGLNGFRWTDSTLTAGVTPVKGVHIAELRSALRQAYEAAGRNVGFSTAVVKTGWRIRAWHINELRRAVEVMERSVQ